jgi:hypothetical protein
VAVGQGARRAVSTETLIAALRGLVARADREGRDDDARVGREAIVRIRQLERAALADLTREAQEMGLYDEEP